MSKSEQRIRQIRAAWNSAEHQLGVTLSDPGPLIARYEEPHRVYHGTNHIASALRTAFFLGGYHSDPIVDLALIFHDAVYVVGAKDNEAASARLAEDEFYAIGYAYLAEEIAALIHATEASYYSHRPVSYREALVRDADLAGFVDPAVCEANAKKVEAEFMPLCGNDRGVYLVGRDAFLKSMLELPLIYYSPRAISAGWEEAARENITNEIAGA